MSKFKEKIMLTFNRHCGNCEHSEGLKCMIPVKRLYAFEGVKATPLDRICHNVIATSNCKWKRKKNNA